MRSDDIIAYTHPDGFMLCVGCWENLPPDLRDSEFAPYFEDDRTGDESCDSCFTGACI